MKQVLRSKDRINLLDYELKNLHKLKLRLAREWRTISAKAEENVKYVHSVNMYCTIVYY